MSSPKTSVIIDVLIAANIVLDLIEAFQKAGVEIDLSQLDTMLEKRRADRLAKLKELGLIQ